MNNSREIVVFGGGCFWCTEAVFSQLRGVISVKPGYAGGATANPSYEEVCTGDTGHAEVVQIEYDPAEISYHDLLTVFFATHDPTTPNRQGADVGTEYRSVVLYTSDDQRRETEAFIHDLNVNSFGGQPLVTTQVQKLEKFYQAEEYHHEFFFTNPQAPYCQFVIYPKLVKLHKEFQALLRTKSKASDKAGMTD